MKFGLQEITIKRINDVFAKHPQVELVILYGSRAKGNYKNGSDIDLTLHGKSLSHQILLNILGEMDELPLPYKIDISIFDTIDNPDLIEHIQRIGKSFYKKHMKESELP